jgi:hypothetical protein
MPPLTVIVSEIDDARVRNLVPEVYTSLSAFLNDAIQHRLEDVERKNGIERIKMRKSIAK